VWSDETAPSNPIDAQPADPETTEPTEPIESGPSDPGDRSRSADGQAVSVERVIDGDSLKVVVGDRSIELRLEGYNAPELYGDRDSVAGPTCNGAAAKAAVEELVDSDVNLTLVEHEQDRFGRTLGDLIVDDQSMVATLVTRGEGLATGDSEVTRSLMRTAAESRIGVWSDRCATGATPAVRIGAHQVDPPGNDRSNLIEEWVEIVNESGTRVLLDDWVLRDDTTGHRFRLSGPLGAGDGLIVRSGGDPGDSGLNGSNRTLYLGESFPVWSNSGETIILTDPNGSFVDWLFVDPE
jgi:endonuclease YncB( thermonuclease family)